MASKPEQEPSIEEILASIRQIISDDDQPRESALDLTQAPEEKFEIPVAPPEPEKKPSASFADVLELTNEIRDEEQPDIAMEEAAPDLDFSLDDPEPVAEEEKPEAPVAQTPEPVFETATQEDPVTPANPSESLFSKTAAVATSAAFSKLMGNIPVEREENKTLYADGKITLEDMVRDMLRPMLREWIDANVPAMVERLVEKELEKLARQARDD